MSTPPTSRPRAEDFLELVQKAKRGRLKLYIGFAAGVGKTYRMLEEAHALKARGVDVVVGFVESHGRKDTEALVTGLEVVPRRTIEYRGVSIEEMSLNNILKRNPAVALVDELAHTNVPGSRNRKRYQDVIELLDAGINVIGAFNVQHLESLNDIVERATGVVRPRDDSGRLPAPGRPGREPGSGGGRPAGAAARREDLRRRQDPLGAGALLQGAESGPPARARAARGRGERRARERAAGSCREPTRGAGARRARGSWCACRRRRRAAAFSCARALAWRGVSAPTGSSCSSRPPRRHRSTSMPRRNGI